MPDWISELRSRLASLALTPEREAEIIEELSLHLDERYRELCATEPADTARTLALAELGETAALSGRLSKLRQSSAAHALPPPAGAPRRRLGRDLWNDVRYAVRMLRKQPGLATAAILTLGLGIGANTAIFSLVHAALLRPLPVRDIDTLALVHNGRPGGVFSYPAYADLRDRNDVFTHLAAFGGIMASLNADAQTDLITGAIVSGSFFPTLGVEASEGRLLGPEDDVTPMAHPVVAISDSLWQNRFGGRADIVGRDVLLNGHRFTIVGVTPAVFRGIQPGLVRDFYVPLMMQPLMRPPRAGFSGEMNPDLLGRRDNQWLFAVARLKPGATVVRAEASLSALATSLAAVLQPPAQAGAPPAPTQPRRVPVTPLAVGDADQRAQMVSVARLLATVVGIVLLIACANVANLLLARAVSRRSEIALRLALGADRWRLVRQLLTESVVMGGIGGLVGVSIAWLIAAAFRAAPPPAGALPIGLEFPLDLPVLGFALALSLLTGLVFGLVPAFGASRPGLLPALKSSVDRSDASSWRPRWFHLRSLLVVSQVALSIALLVAAGLFLRSLQRAQGIDPGYDVERLLTVPLNVNILRYTTPQGREFYARVTETVSALPGVRSASVARVGLLPGAGRILNINIEGRAAAAPSQSEGTRVALSREMVAANVIGPRYFEALQLAIRRGRDFGPEDTTSGVAVAIVNETFVQRHLDGTPEGLGQRLSIRGPMGPWLTIVGVVADSKYATLSETPTPVVYLPLSQNHETGMTLIVRAAGDAAAMIPSVRSAIRDLDPNLPITGVRSGGEILGANLYTARMGAVLLGGFAGLALLLAAIGMYGVLAFSTQRRTREMGIRLALGAQPRRVFLMIVREGLLLVVIGGAIGLAASLAGGRLLSSFLYGVSARDVVTFVSVPAVLVAVALAACAVPARRAMRVDPVIALRSE